MFTKVFNHRKTKRDKINGSITVFISMIMLLILAVVTTVIEVARVTSSYTRAEQVTDISLESCFSSYAKEVFEDYGIMMLWRNIDEFKTEYSEYVNKNTVYKDILYSYSDVYGIKYSDIEIQEKINPLDNGGEYIADQIYSYMKLALSEDLVEEILGKCTSLNQSDDINEFYDDMEKCSDTMEAMEDNVKVIYDNVITIRECEFLPVDLLNNMKTNLENIANNGGEDNYSIEVRDNYFDLYKYDFKKYMEWEKTIENSLYTIIEQSDDYDVNVNNTKKNVSMMEESINKKKDSLDKELYDIMKKEIININNELLNYDKDIYNVSANKKNAVIQKEIVDNVKNSMSSIIEETNQLIYDYNKLSNYDNGDKLIKESYTCVCNALNDISRYDCSVLEVNYSKPQGKRKKNEVVEFVKKIKKDGLLGYVTDGEFSEKEISTDKLPSKINSVGNDYEWDNLSNLNEDVKKALIGQYIFDKFGSFMNKAGNSPLAYEVEYIITGKPSDKENLNSVISKIVAIREGFNLIFLVKDSVKREEAHKAALAITGFTGMPVIVRVTQFLILGAWAYAESIVDVKDLLSGYNVKIMKEKNEWNLSLSGIKSLNSTDNEREKRSGLSYKDYLRSILFLQNKSQQVLRIMDMIEANIQSKYNDSFKIADCMVGVTLNTKYKIKRVFSIIGYSKDYIVYKDDKFVINILQSFKY